MSDQKWIENCTADPRELCARVKGGLVRFRLGPGEIKPINAGILDDIRGNPAVAKAFAAELVREVPNPAVTARIKAEQLAKVKAAEAEAAEAAKAALKTELKSSKPKGTKKAKAKDIGL